MDFLFDNDEEEVIEESIKGKIGSSIRDKKDKKSVAKHWANHGTMNHRTYHSKKVTDKDFEDMVEAFNDAKKAKTYTEYKKHFARICRLFMIPMEGCIIQYYKFIRGKKPDTNEVCVTWSNTRQKIIIPQGSRLYHNSKNDNIKELTPFFKGKKERGFLYSSPRVYLTIRKDYPLQMLDLKANTKTTLYVVKENIRTAYVDPLVPGFKLGAVYVETQFPIKVEKVKPQQLDDKKDNKSKNVKESVEEDFQSFVSLEEFCEHYGLIIVDDDDTVVEESIGSVIGKAVRHAKDEDYIRKHKIGANGRGKRTITKNVSERECDKLKDAYEDIKKGKDFKKYKRSYDYFCKSFGLNPTNTSIRSFTTEDSVIKNKIDVSVEYKETRKKVMIPNGSKLVHISSNKSVKELIPSFFSKINGWFNPPSKRVYLKIDKDTPLPDTGSKVKYTPKENIRTAFIDTGAESYKNGSVYMDTQFPVPVKPIKDDKKKNNKDA